MKEGVIMVLPASIAYATAISIIIIGLAIFIWLVLTIVFGTMLLKKVNILTKNFSSLTETWNMKSKQIADQTTETIHSYLLPSKTEKVAGKKSNFTSLFNTALGLGSLVYEVIKIVNLFKSKKER